MPRGLFILMVILPTMNGVAVPKKADKLSEQQEKRLEAVFDAATESLKAHSKWEAEKLKKQTDKKLAKDKDSYEKN